MSWKNTENRYGFLSIGIHWLMVLLFIAVYACIELRVLYPKGSDLREALKAWHFMVGMLIFLLVALRLAARLSGPTPEIRPEPPSWMQITANLLHFGLYLLMVVMPLTGWLLLSVSGKPFPFFGLELPALIGQNKGLEEPIKEIHEFVGTAGYYLIGLHAAAALYHHYFVHDNTLTRMLPGRD